MRLAVIAATSAFAHASLSPYNMTKAICYAPDNVINNTRCHQQVFDALVQAELSAIAKTRQSQVDTDALAAKVAATANAVAWAYQNVMATLKKHNLTWQ